MEDEQSKKYLDKDKRIKAEEKRLNSILAKIEVETKKTVQSLVKNAAFMAISLEDLQKIINQKGYVEEYQNGATQKGFKKCSEVEIYNTMIKNHSAIMKQLVDLLPKGNSPPQEKNQSDGFDNFVNGREDI